MAIRVGGTQSGGLGPPFRKKQFRHNSAQGFRNDAPFDSRTGADAPLMPTQPAKIGVTDEEIEFGKSGTVSVWKRKTGDLDGAEEFTEDIHKNIKGYWDWGYDELPLPEGTKVLLIEFPDENLWRIFPLIDISTVVLERCGDGLQVVSFDLFLNQTLGYLSDNLNKIIRLKGSPLLEEDCWRIVESSERHAEISPIVCAVYDTCIDCEACWLLIQCENADITKVVKQLDVCDAGHVILEGDVVLLSDGECYYVTKSHTCDGFESVSFLATFSSCDICANCYRLAQCWGNKFKTIYVANHDLNVNDVVRIAGQCWEVVEENACIQFPGPIEHVDSFDVVYEDCEECGCYLFVACPGNTRGDIKVAGAVDLDDADQDLEALIGQIVMLTDGRCYLVAAKSVRGCDSAVSVQIVEAYDECEYCTSYTLTPCPGQAGAVEITTHSDLQDWYLNSGTIIKRAEDDFCYTITSTQPYTPSDVVVTVEAEWDGDCTACTSPTYGLNPICDSCADADGDNCDNETGTNITTVAGGGTFKVTDYDFSASLGQFVKIDGECYQIEINESGDGVSSGFESGSISFTGPYETCKICQVTCLWIVHEVVDDSDAIVQRRTKIMVDRVCQEDENDVIAIEDC